MRTLNTLLSTVCLVVTCGVSNAQTVDAAKALSIQELAHYQGADRTARLIEGAKREGSLSVYHVYPALTNIMNE
ncbi:MAG: hypothetical protein WCO34_05685, partial [Betaproteobacteria bacterium]